MGSLKIYAATLLLAASSYNVDKNTQINLNQVDVKTAIEYSGYDFNDYALVIENDDFKNLETMDLDDYNFDTLILNKVCLEDGKKIDLDKIKYNHLWVIDSAVNTSTIDLNDYNDINIVSSYNLGKKIDNEKIDNGSFLNPEYQKYYTKYKKQIKTIAKKIKKKSNGTKKDMIRLATLYVVDNLKYDSNYLGDSDDNVMNSIFKDKKGVCLHYMNFETRLLRELGIYCLDVVGYTNEEKTDESAHAWNKVYLNGKWYSIDATWLDNKKGIKDLKKKKTNTWYMAKEDSMEFNSRHYPLSDSYNLIPKTYRKV